MLKCTNEGMIGGRMDLLSEKGYEKRRRKEIARKGNVSEGSILGKFKKKRGVIGGIMKMK